MATLSVYISFDSQEPLEEALLQPEERDYLALFRHPEARLRFLSSRGALRRALSSWGQGPWTFHRRDSGQWSVVGSGGATPFVSLSHGGGAVVVAIGEVPVGVDVEPLETPRWPLDGVLAPGEISSLRRRGRGTDVVRLWTAKEAVAKWSGLGERLDFSSFELALDPVRFVSAGPQLAHLPPMRGWMRSWSTHGNSYNLCVVAGREVREARFVFEEERPQQWTAQNLTA